MGVKAVGGGQGSLGHAGSRGADGGAADDHGGDALGGLFDRGGGADLDVRQQRLVDEVRCRRPADRSVVGAVDVRGETRPRRC